MEEKLKMDPTVTYQLVFRLKSLSCLQSHQTSTSPKGKYHNFDPNWDPTFKKSEHLYSGASEFWNFK